jgi:hypothetical protein
MYLLKSGGAANIRGVTPALAQVAADPDSS